MIIENKLWLKSNICFINTANKCCGKALIYLLNMRFINLIIITHDENIALQADRIIAIDDGKITRDEVIRK